MKKYIVLTLILCMVFCVACQKADNTSETEVDNTINSAEVEEDKTEETQEEAMEKITLYYSDNQVMFLCKEERMVSSENAKDPVYILNELMKGPENSELYGTIPDNVTVNSAKIEGEVCIVDISQSFAEIPGTTGQMMALYSVVNTLCSIDGVEKVRFVIDGEENPRNYVIDFSEDFELNMDIISK